MASSSAHRNKSGALSKVPCWFKAEINPSKEEIYMCPQFAKKYSSNMNLNYYGWIDSKGKPSTMVVFKRKDDRCYISDGRIVARKNGFQRSTTVIIYFQGVDNRFAMYPAIYEVGSSVLKPPPSTPVPSWSVHPISYFKTVISPQEDKIQICPIFLYNYESIIDFNSPALITDRNNKSVSVTFKNKTGSWYFKYAFVVANTFGFTKPTTVYFDFQFKYNRFILSTSKPNSTVNRVADKRPIILSDKDDSDEDDEENIHQFDVKVTHSLAYNDQVLHFPNKVSKYALVENQKQIYLRDVDTRRVYNCTVITSKWCEAEKYLGKGWYTFKKERHLNPDDVLRCTIEDPPQYLNVQVIRAAAAR